MQPARAVGRVEVDRHAPAVPSATAPLTAAAAVAGARSATTTTTTTTLMLM